MNCYALIPLALSLVYFLGRLYGRTAHDRTYYSSFYELFLLLTAVYIAPLGGVPVALTLGVLLVALVAIFLLRWFVGDKGLLPTGQLLRKRYPWLYRFCTAVLSGSFICLTPYFLPGPLYNLLMVIVPLVVVLVERLSLYWIHKRSA